METQKQGKHQYRLQASWGYRIGFIILGLGLTFDGFTRGLGYGINHETTYLFAGAAITLTYFMIINARITIKTNENGLRLSSPRNDVSNQVQIVEAIEWNDGIEYAIRTDRGVDALLWAFVEGFTLGYAKVPYLFLYSSEGLLLRTLSTSGDFEALLKHIDDRSSSATSPWPFSLCIAGLERSVVKLCKVSLQGDQISFHLDQGIVSGRASQLEFLHPLQITHAEEGSPVFKSTIKCLSIESSPVLRWKNSCGRFRDRN